MWRPCKHTGRTSRSVQAWEPCRAPAEWCNPHEHVLDKWLQVDEVPAPIWDLVELALQSYKSGAAPARTELDGAIKRACKQVPNGTYLGSTVRFLLRKHSCPADL